MNKTEAPLKEVLARTRWFQEMPTGVKERVLADASERRFKEREFVARQNEPASYWIGVAEGLLKVSAVYRTGKVVMFMAVPEGAWVGEGSVLKRELRRYDVIAMRPSRVILLPGATVRWLVETSIEFCHMMMIRLNERLGQYIGMVEIDRLSDPVARVARAIATLYNPVMHPDMSPLVGLSQTELGELIGMSRQLISAGLKRLQAEGLISVAYGGVLVRDLPALAKYPERDRR